jgi:hypothetical protein
MKDDEIAKKLAELDKIGKDLDESKFGYNAKIIRELREAGTSGDKAFALWLDCKKEIDFDQKGKLPSEWAEWKRAQTKDPNHERDDGLQLCVQWLSIVVMYCNGRTDSARNEAVTAATAFVDTMVDRLKKIEKDKEGGGGRDGRFRRRAEGENEIDGDVLSSVIAKHFKLDASVSRKDAGAFVAGDIGGIYEKMIMPFYRTTKQSGQLMAAWKRRIDQETAIAEAQRGTGPKEKFATEKLPELKWGQAVDYFKAGQEDAATGAMMRIVKDNLTHKRASAWIAELTALLKKEEYPPPGGDKSGARPAPAPVPAPAPTPEPAPEEAEPTSDTKAPTDSPKPPPPGVRPVKS